jgi:DUF3073 family protein
MGRGRAKAKQTKVARDLKYRTHETDFGALARELHGEDDSGTDAGTDEASDEYDDDWSGYAEQSRE